MGKLNWGKRACAAFVLCVASATTLLAQKLVTLHSFNNTDGFEPEAAVVQGTDGNLYGTTTYGGPKNRGTVFKVTLGGTLTTLHNFHSTDGANPCAGLVLGTDGSFYGATNADGAYGYGTLFKITAVGLFTTLHDFKLTDGAYPLGTLIQGFDGNFYGTTNAGGANGYGTVFRITAAGVLTTLHDFDSTHGAYPQAGLVQGNDGNFYGTTAGGGASTICSNGCGTVFKITTAGALTMLHSFDDTDGDGPYALIQGDDGNFYGVTLGGGTNPLDGTIFKITPTGTLTTLHDFDGTDGADPRAGLVLAGKGNLYGTTGIGGTSNACNAFGVVGCGTIFEVTPSGALTTLHSFRLTDGYGPSAALLQDTSGIFYGTTYAGGTHGGGTIFSLSVGLGPFVKTQPTSGKPGQLIKILGTNLIGSKIVTFNGTAAVFKVISSSLITATVPAKATSGEVRVTTSSGRTLSSNAPFRVLP